MKFCISLSTLKNQRWQRNWLWRLWWLWIVRLCLISSRIFDFFFMKRRSFILILILPLLLLNLKYGALTFFLLIVLVFVSIFIMVRIMEKVEIFNIFIMKNRTHFRRVMFAIHSWILLNNLLKTSHSKICVWSKTQNWYFMLVLNFFKIKFTNLWENWFFILCW